MSNLKKILCLISLSAFYASCLANEERQEDNMVAYLSNNKYLQGKAEIVFLLDRSGSIGAADFETEVGFVKSFLTHIVVDVNASRVAVISFSDIAKKHIDYLKEPKSKCFLEQELHDIAYEDSAATNTAAALEEARLVFKNARPNVNKVVVLISDGLATKGGDPAEAANKLKAEGVEIFCFGVGRVVKKELEKLASNEQNIHTCSGYREFQRLARKIRGDPHESSWSKQSTPNCDYLCDSIYKGDPNDPGCCDHHAVCSCALLSGLHTCVCEPGYYGLTGQIGDCKACPRGTYKSKLEPSSSCTPCPPGSTTDSIGSKKLSDCFCKEGHVGDPSKNISCKLINCPLLQKPARGYILGTCDTSYGSTCYFMCEEGYELVDPQSDQRSCKSNGEWTGSTTACQEIRCNPPKYPKNGRMVCDPDPLTVDKKCRFSCQAGYVREGSEERICASSKKWTGLETKCIPVTCELPPSLKFGSSYGCVQKQKPTIHETCLFNCNDGFRIEGPRYLTCRENGRLMDNSDRLGRPKCIDQTPPDIICPPPIRIALEKGKDKASVWWDPPVPSDNSGYKPKLMTSPPNIFPKQKFPIGRNVFEYIAVDHAGLRSSCTMYIDVIDEEPPAVLRCPSRVEVSTNDVEIRVYWDEPLFQDNSKRPLRMYQTKKPGDVFQQGSQSVFYVADDESGNRATCEFDVVVSRNACPYFPPPTNGALACDDWMFGSMCQVYCNEKYEFARTPAEWYICNIDSVWETEPLNEPLPWPDCARPILPGAVKKVLGFYYHGNCNDPRVQNYIKKLFLSHVHSSLKFVDLCTRSNACSVDHVKVLCGVTADGSKRKKRDVWQQAEKEKLELEFEITINTDQEFNDTEAVLQDFLKTISDLKWDFDDDLTLATTLSPMQNSPSKEASPSIELNEEKTTIVCKPGSVQIGDLCVLCSSGTFYNSVVQKCLDCPEGYYQELQGQMECEKCPDGTNTEFPRTNNATLCKGICFPGTYSATGLETCISCPVGKYQDSFGMNTCYDCPHGTTTGNVGGMTIEDCKDSCQPGSISQNGIEPCDLCPLHHYQPLYGQTECLECPEQLSTEDKGATEVNQCKDVDPCLNDNTCQNNGSCTRIGRSARCECTYGFNGINCDADIDECESKPCLNDGQCVNTEGSFFCKCLDGFTGSLCEIEIDECATDPCLNNGTCIDKVNGFTCVCSNGYEGIQCEIERELCFKDVVCLSEGICMFGEDDNSSFCECGPGFSGIDCSLNVNECENITCQNNGSCIDGINSFSCACPSGFTGTFCETDIDECEYNYCQSGSYCQDLVGAYRCLCPPGWNGTFCENKMHSDFILMFPETTATIANMAKLTLNTSLSHATISLWVQTNDAERSGTPLSYAVASAKTTSADGSVIDNALTISDCSAVKIYVNNEPVVTDLELADGQWHHLVFTWSSENYGTWALYKDGELRNEGSNLRPNEVINEGGSLIIGQEQDTLGGGFSPVETFTGNITRVNIWNSYFSKTNITRLCNMDDDIPDKVIAWPDFLQGLKGDVQIARNSRPMIRN